MAGAATDSELASGPELPGIAATRDPAITMALSGYRPQMQRQSVQFLVMIIAAGLEVGATP